MRHPSNPAFATLAYQHSIIQHLISDMLEEYYGSDTQEPRKHIICEHLPREDEVVPTDEILFFVEELKDKRTQLEAEMRRFEFVRKGGDQVQSMVDTRNASLLHPRRVSGQPKSKSKRAKSKRG
jgi:hypothetical protein